MPEKEKLTEKAILCDIRYSIRHPNEPTEAEYKRQDVIGWILLILTLASFLLGIRVGVTVLFSVLGGGVLYTAICFILRCRQQKRIQIDQYEIAPLVLSHKEEESYTRIRDTGKQRRRELITLYMLHFEGGKSYTLPKRNYKWSHEFQLSDRFVYEMVHRGDRMIAVTEKESGEIAMVYPTVYFDYKP